MSEQMISDIDKDGSGSIDFEEFLDMMYVLVVEVLIQGRVMCFPKPGSLALVHSMPGFGNLKI